MVIEIVNFFFYITIEVVVVDALWYDALDQRIILGEYHNDRNWRMSYYVE